LPDSDVQPGNGGALAYEDIPGFCKSATLDEIHAHDYVLTLARYVGLGDLDEDDEPFEEKMERLTAELDEQFEASAQLEQIIRNNLEMLGGV
jgi:type I restriction enzyme M protein